MATIMKYTKLNNTYFAEAKSHPKDRIEIEVGDSKQPDFKPRFKFMRWDNEVNFLAYNVDSATTVTRVVVTLKVMRT